MDTYNPDKKICYVQNGYDRSSLVRKRKRHLENSLRNGTARLIFIFEGKAGVVRREAGFEAGFVESGHIPQHRWEKLHGIFLGELRGQPVFAIPCDEHPRELLGLGAEQLRFIDLKQTTALMPLAHASLLGYGLAMNHWHRTHRFCGICGSATESTDSGHIRTCTNRDCGKQQFPRTDPAVIVLVESGDACLLGRKSGWADRRYSTIAGFVEPGETPEQAVYREVFEETGTIVQKVRYFASQPWPFPGSLMLGYFASAHAGLVSLKDNELQDARWYTRDEIREWVPSGRLRLPTRVSIAYRLLEEWFDTTSDISLDELNPENLKL